LPGFVHAIRPMAFTCLLCLFVTASCFGLPEDPAAAPSLSGQDTQSGLRFYLGYENDRFNGTDDEHTSAFLLDVTWRRDNRDWGILVLLESLTTRETRFHLDILSILGRHQRPLGRGTVGFIAGGQVNGNLGSQKIENWLHRLLGEGLLDFEYPDRYVGGVCGGLTLHYPLAEAGPFRFSGEAEGRLATRAGPSFVRGGIFAAAPFRLWSGASLRPQFGVTVQDHFNLADILKIYYGRSYSLDSSLQFRWGNFTLDLYFRSDPYGNEQSIAGGGIGYWFN